MADRAEVRRLRDDEGLTFKEIAARLGCSLSTAHAVYHDPTGAQARARKDRYRMPCRACGVLTNPGGLNVHGFTGLCKRCVPGVAGEARRRWTQRAVIRAIQEWAALHGGEPPTSRSWGAPGAGGSALHPDYLREPHRWPHYNTVRRRFGEDTPRPWSRAIAAAGFTPREPGANHAR